jgi:rare lipoprotein A
MSPFGYNEEMPHSWLSRSRCFFLAVAVAVGSACAGRAPARPQVPTASAAPSPGVETGMASWYGNPYHGRRAASGEIFDMEKLTAAHRTLPFGTRVRVTETKSGHSVEVRINDRGPFAEDRIIDVSRAAARRLGLLGSGKALVRLEVLGAVPARSGETYAVQVGAFRERPNAERLCAAMERRYGSAQILEREGSPPVWRVLVGRAGSAEEAGALARRIRSDAAAAGGAPFVVRVD